MVIDELLDGLDGLIVDLDGVVYIGDRAVPGSPEAIAALRGRGLRLVFVTNDPVGSRAGYAEKLRGMGVSVEPGEIVTSASALAAVLRGERSVRAVFAIGSAALKSELAAVGLVLLSSVDAMGADAVVVAGHPAFDYDELRAATQAVSAGARLYAAGRDPTFPMPDGPWPATGAILAAVEYATGRRAIVVGKPERHIFDIARAIVGPEARLAVVGDRIDSDIEGGRRAGLRTVLVLSGSTAAAEQTAADLVVADLRALAGKVGQSSSRRT